jgi:hypothetical protein
VALNCLNLLSAIHISMIFMNGGKGSKSKFTGHRRDDLCFIWGF